MQDEKLLKDYSKLISIHFLNTIFILYLMRIKHISLLYFTQYACTGMCV